MRMRSPLMVLFLSVGCFGFAGQLQGQQATGETTRKVIRKVDPQYPQVARKMNLGGTVKMIAVVGADGTVKRIEPVGGSPLLMQAAENAISQWKFAAGAESREIVELHFTP